MALLEASCGNTGFRVHAHVARAIASLSQALLQGTALDFARLYPAFPFENLDELRNASARHLTSKQDGLLEHLLRNSRLGRLAPFALRFQPAEALLAVFRQIPAQRSL